MYLSMTLPLSATQLLICPLFVLLALLIRGKERPRPGPPGLPVVGNLLQIPKSHPWLQFQDWSKLYGESDTFRPLSDL